MDFDLSIALESLTAMLEGFLASLPAIGVGILVLLIFVLLAALIQRLVVGAVKRAHLSDQAAGAVGRITRWGVILLGILMALTVIFPSVDVAALLGALGVTSVAIGFAFRDVLQNFFAGLILMLTEPFRVGDQIVFKEYEGTVKEINTRATRMYTYDGRDVIVPNAELFMESVTVNTAHEMRRSQYDVGIGYGDDIEEARALLLETTRGVEGVLTDPAPDVIVVALADFTVNLRVRWWTDAGRADVLQVQDRVLTAVKNRLSRRGIDLPFPTYQLLFHDQTEETDGDRSRQREGWPAVSGENPEPRRIVDALGEFREELATVSGNNR